MAEYIEREEAIDALTERNLVVHMDSVNDGLVASCHRSAQRIIANIPAADVRPIMMGKWMWDEENWWHKCSACGMTFGYDGTYELFDHGFQLANFCPNCGSKMIWVYHAEEGE